MGVSNSYIGEENDDRKNCLVYARTAEIRSRKLNRITGSQSNLNNRSSWLGNLLYKFKPLEKLMYKIDAVHTETFFYCSFNRVQVISFNGDSNRYEITEYKIGDEELKYAQQNSQVVQSYNIKNNNSVDELLDYCDELAKIEYSLIKNNCKHSANQLQQKFGQQ